VRRGWLEVSRGSLEVDRGLLEVVRGSLEINLGSLEIARGKGEFNRVGREVTVGNNRSLLELSVPMGESQCGAHAQEEGHVCSGE
jgi:hypothetical protein